MKQETIGMVTAVKKQWWLKVNTKPVRRHATDGAVFPHIITVEYTVNGQTYKKRKWVHASCSPLAVGSEVTVCYEQGKPGRVKVII